MAAGQTYYAHGKGPFLTEIRLLKSTFRTRAKSETQFGARRAWQWSRRSHAMVHQAGPDEILQRLFH